MADHNEVINEFLKDKPYNRYIPKEGTIEKALIDYLNSRVTHFVGESVLDLKIEIFISYIDNSNINAAVKKIGNVYYIWLFRGVVTELKSFISSFVINNLPISVKTMEVDNITSFSFFHEDECEHHILANIFACNIMYLILFHEIGHILCGHCDNDEFKSTYYEACENTGDIEHQSREYMADFFGLINSYFFQSVFLTDSISSYINHHICYLISLYCLYIYFDKGITIRVKTELLDRTHPHPTVRLLYMLDLIDNEIKFELLNLYKVDWAEENNIDRVIRNITNTGFTMLCEFSDIIDEKYNLVSRMFEDDVVEVRQAVQNYASDVFNNHYAKYSLVSFNIGKVEDQYVQDVVNVNIDYLKKLTENDIGLYEAYKKASHEMSDEEARIFYDAVKNKNEVEIRRILSNYMMLWP